MSDGFLFIEGFEGDEDSLVWQSMMATAGGEGRLAGAARTGSYGIRSTGGGGASPLWTATSHVVCGFAFRCVGSAPASELKFFANMGSSARTWSWVGLTPQMTLWCQLSQDGLGMSGWPTAYSTFQLDLDTWYYIEVSLTANAGGNILRIQVNGPAGTPGSTGFEVLTHTGPVPVMTYNTYNQIGIGNNVGGVTYDFDDIYVRDGAVGGWVGDTEIMLLDLEDDRSVDFTRLSGAKNYLMVNEVAPDDDTTYNEANASPSEDLFEIGNEVFTGDIHCVQLVARARKTDTEVWSLRTTLDLSGNRDYGTSRPLAQTYETFPPDVFVDAPGGTGWTLADLNSLGVGYVTEWES